MNIQNNYSGMKVLVMGLGLNGGGLASAVYMARRGAQITVTDLRDEKTLAPSIKELEAELSRPVRYVLGRHEMEDFKTADMVIKNPGVRPDSPYLAVAKHIETDISLFLSESRARLTAVTGSKGKSSIASALYWVLNEWSKCKDNPDAGKRKAYLGGNITLSPLNFVDELNEGDDVVLELSSFQLGDIGDKINAKTKQALLRPRAAVISAIMPDHLDRYGTMDAYIADKRIIYKGQENNDVLVTENDCWGQNFRNESRSRSLVYSDIVLPRGMYGGWIDKKSGRGLARLEGLGKSMSPDNSDIVEAVPANLLVPGKHQKKNLLAASLALLDLGLPADFIHDSLGKFPGIEHRLEFFHESRGIRFYNDSAATIPEAAAAAIRAFEKPPVLVCGGTDKNLDFTPLVNALNETKASAMAHNSEKAAAPILLAGSGSDKLIPLMQAIGLDYHGPFNTLQEALEAALETAQAGDAVVLSPGCTSFGMFLNEFDRGNKWKETVKRFA